MKKVTTVLLLAFAGPLLAQTAPQGQGTPDPTEMFMKQADTNKDGKVSMDEFLMPMKQQFKYIDKNNDGSISREEAQAFNQQMQQRMQQMRERAEQQRGQRQGAPPQGGYEPPAGGEGGYGQ